MPQLAVSAFAEGKDRACRGQCHRVVGARRNGGDPQSCESSPHAHRVQLVLQLGLLSRAASRLSATPRRAAPTRRSGGVGGVGCTSEAELPALPAALPRNAGARLRKNWKGPCPTS